MVDGRGRYLVPGLWDIHVHTGADERALLVEAGLSPAEALRAATSSPALFLGLSGSLGTIGAGKTADLVLLEADPLQTSATTGAWSR